LAEIQMARRVGGWVRRFGCLDTPLFLMGEKNRGWGLDSSNRAFAHHGLPIVPLFGKVHRELERFFQGDFVRVLL
jgi:hypothetical protein